MEKTKSLMVIIIVLLLLVLGGVVGLAVYTVNALNKTGVADNTGGNRLYALSSENIETYDINDIKANLAKGTDNKTHMASVDISLGINKTDKKSSEKLIEILNSSEAILKSSILTVIRNRTNDELLQPDGQDVLASLILEKLQEAFSTNLIVDVYVSGLLVS